jgi:nickel-dependent lactate racemase
LEEIAARVGDAGDRRVYLTREAADAATDHPAAAMVRALAAPLDYPPLVESIVPGDRVAIAVETGVPLAIEVVRGAVDALADAGVDPETCSIVTASDALAQSLRAELNGSGAGVSQVVLHDPDDEKDLCFFGINRRREPLVVNRTIFEADLLLPIGRSQPHGGAYASLFPQFSSTATIELFRTPANLATPAARNAMRKEATEAGRLIGAAMVVQIVPGAGDSVARAVAGEPQAVGRFTRKFYRQHWSTQSPQRANLVVAIIAGGPLAQTWDNVGRALAAAERLVDDDGAIAICTNLDGALGESLGRLVGNTNAEAVARKVLHDHAEDSWAAWQLARALARGPVYFLSQLDADEVEDLGLAPVADIDELVRLANRRESCIVLENAQHAMASVDEE